MADQSTIAVDLIRQEFQQGFRVLEMIMQDVTPELAHWLPPGNANPIGATYVHVVIFKDGTINARFRGKAPLFAAEWNGNIGVSELPPLPTPGSPGLPDWGEWARKVQVDLPTMRQYASAVYADVDAYMSSLTDEDLEHPLEFMSGNWTLKDFLTQAILADIYMHCGEIACMKGIQGVKGYPF